MRGMPQIDPMDRTDLCGGRGMSATIYLAAGIVVGVVAMAIWAVGGKP